MSRATFNQYSIGSMVELFGEQILKIIYGNYLFWIVYLRKNCACILYSNFESFTEVAIYGKIFWPLINKISNHIINYNAQTFPLNIVNSVKMAIFRSKRRAADEF